MIARLFCRDGLAAVFCDGLVWSLLAAGFFAGSGLIVVSRASSFRFSRAVGIAGAVEEEETSVVTEADDRTLLGPSKPNVLPPTFRIALLTSFSSFVQSTASDCPGPL